jgi:hypothetical protein
LLTFRVWGGGRRPGALLDRADKLIVGRWRGR